MKNIESYNFKDFVFKTLSDTKGYSELTEIQKEVIPVALKKKNIIAKSSTGSGKTDAFLVPIMENLYLDSENVEVIIVAPTRELASQIYANAMDYASNNEKLRIKLLMGGFDRKRDLNKKTAAPTLVFAAVLLLFNSFSDAVQSFRKMLLPLSILIFDKSKF